MAHAVLTVAPARRRLRRVRLPRRGPAARNHGGFRRARRRGASARHRRHARHGAVPHLRPARVVPAGAGGRGALPPLLHPARRPRVERPGRPRRAAHQLAVRLRRAGVGVGAAPGEVVPAHARREPARPRLDEPRGAPRLRRRGALLEGARGGRLPLRCGEPHLQARGVRGHAGRLVPPPRGRRPVCARVPAGAGGRGRYRRHAHGGRDGRDHAGELHPLHAPGGPRAEHDVQLPPPEGRLRRRRQVGAEGAGYRGAAEALCGLAGGHAGRWRLERAVLGQPRPAPRRDALRRARGRGRARLLLGPRGQDARRAELHHAGHALHLPGRRAGHGQRRVRVHRRLRRRGERERLPPAPRGRRVGGRGPAHRGGALARQRPHAHAVDRRPCGGLHRRRALAGGARDRREGERRGRGRRRGLHARVLPRPRAPAPRAARARRGARALPGRRRGRAVRDAWHRMRRAPSSTHPFFDP